MKLADYLAKHEITQAAFAEKLRVSQGLVYQWLAGKRPVAPAHCPEIERLTGGEITRRDLHEKWHLIWPELVDSDHPAPEEKAA